MIAGIGEETKGYRVYLPRDHVVVTTQHVKTFETLDKTQNEQIQRLHQGEEYEVVEEKTTDSAAGAARTTDTGDATTGSRGKKKSKGRARKKPRQRERHVTRSAARKAAEYANDSPEQEEPNAGVVNNVIEADPTNYREAMRSPRRDGWLKAMAKELDALENNDVWKLVRMPDGVRALHTKWVYKTKRDAEDLLKRLKAQLVACGNEQEFGVNYGITFAAVIEMTSVKLILVLARKWGVPAKHGEVPNAYVKDVKEAEPDIYLRIPQGKVLPDELLRGLGVTSADEVVLELRNALYGLRQAG
ncbi:unnamed protein product [Phytophthora fragariaefolia]|uniref:Unnamed protein product n=1 Tax=Phytophthora fragariaefolia TaxID=1490495 RepID=A0A9W7CYH2_9STRA|nr:unnamed protein product [Phytophthora fragariaefolia]